MEYRAYWLLPTLAVALTLCGCGGRERRPEPVFPGVVLMTASTGDDSKPGLQLACAVAQSIPR